MMKVYFDTKSLIQGHALRGIGYYTENLLLELKKSKEIKLVDRISDADIVHFPYFDFFFDTLRPVLGRKNVVTIYDTIPLIYPKHYPPGLRGKINFIKQKKRLSQVDCIITISETSKKDIVRLLDVPQEKIFPIHLAASNIYKKLETGNWKLEITKRFNLPNRFVLYVGDVNYNKNLLGLADGCTLADTPLVIVGKSATVEIERAHIENRPFAEFLQKYGNSPKVIRLGFVETEDLVKIYNLASVYCQPSFYEGFGLPILEAQSCGTPVIASKTQALVEIAGDSCLFFDPYKTQDISDAIKKVISSKIISDQLAKKGILNAQKYSWKKAAKETLNIIKNLKK